MSKPKICGSVLCHGARSAPSPAQRHAVKSKRLAFTEVIMVRFNNNDETTIQKSPFGCRLEQESPRIFL